MWRPTSSSWSYRIIMSKSQFNFPAHHVLDQWRSKGTAGPAIAGAWVGGWRRGPPGSSRRNYPLGLDHGPKHVVCEGPENCRYDTVTSLIGLGFDHKFTVSKHICSLLSYNFLYQYSVPDSKHTSSKLRSLSRLFPISLDCLPGFWFLLFSFYALSNMKIND